MTERPSDSHHRDAQAFEVDTSTAHPARLYNYLAGGDDNFSADRTMADYLSEVIPGGMETARAHVQVMADFVERAVQHLVDAGIRQFLAVGVTIPSDDHLHVVAQRLAPESRVVYVGDDPVVLAHAHELRRSSPEGAAAYIHDRQFDPKSILDGAADTLDLAQPVAVVLLGTLNVLPDERDPYGLVAKLMDGVPSGSYLVILHTTDEIADEWMVEAAKRLAEMLGTPHVVRTHDEILRFFTGLDLLGPGLVPLHQWHPPSADPDNATPTTDPIPLYAALARKP